jgi:DNA-directed RNA polymerase subunit RPC12/RpoP
MAYVCGNCSTEINSVEDGLLRCPKCGFRIVYKKRDPVAKTIKVD